MNCFFGVIVLNKVVKNSSWIIACKIVQSLLNLVVSMLTARYLGPSNYGVINYAASIVAFMLPLMQLGFRSTLVYELIHRPNEEGKTLGTALLMNVLSALLCMVAVAFFVVIANRGEKTTILVCVLYSINLIFQALEMCQYWFQKNLMSKYTSLISLIAYIIVSIYKIYLLVVHKNIYWFSVAQAIDYCIISIALLVTYKKCGGEKFSFSFERGKEMLAKSKYYIISGMMVTIFAQTDRLMIKNMIGDTATGYYSAAVTSAGMASFVFAAIIDSMRPVILESKEHSTLSFELNVSRLFSMIFYMSLIQCILTTILAKPIIWILYGEDYLSSVDVLRLVVWYMTYSYIGQVRNIWILAEKKQNYLVGINLIGALLNVLINALLIPICGIMGAAIASVITQFFTNFILGFIFNPIKDCNRLMLKGMNPQFALNQFRCLISKKE